MQPEQLWLFITLTFFVSASPGPVMLSCMADAGRFGFGKSLFTMLGASTGNLVLMLVSALGLSLVVQQSEWIFHTIKWIGAAYLIYLGIQLFLAPPQSITVVVQQTRNHHLFLKSFMVAITNPKGLIYFGALFPQFIDIQKSMLPQFTLLAIIFLLMDLVWMMIYAKGGSVVMRWMTSPEHQRLFNRLCGCALILTGIILLFADMSH
jgi:homoserine/homoserine lactone efflux protein